MKRLFILIWMSTFFVCPFTAFADDKKSPPSSLQVQQKITPSTPAVTSSATPTWVTVAGWGVTLITLIIGWFVLKSQIRLESEAKLNHLRQETRTKLFELSIEAIGKCTSLVAKCLEPLSKLRAAEENADDALASEATKEVMKLREKLAEAGLLVPPELDGHFQDLEWKISKCINAYRVQEYTIDYSINELESSFNNWRVASRDWKNTHYPVLNVTRPNV